MQQHPVFVARVGGLHQGLLHGEVALTEGTEDSSETAKLCLQDSGARQGQVGAEGSKRAEDAPGAFTQSPIQ